jgi:hypothetical protein
MASTVLTTQPGHVDTTGAGFMVYANRYRDAALASLRHAKRLQGFDPVPYQLLCQSLELHLKSFIWLTERIGRDRIRAKYGHDLEKLWDHSKARQIDRYVRPTPLRDLIIGLVGPHYRNRQFNYLDLDMIFSGFHSLTGEPRILPTLSRLTGRLTKALRRPILAAS